MADEEGPQDPTVAFRRVFDVHRVLGTKSNHLPNLQRGWDHRLQLHREYDERVHGNIDAHPHRVL